jgi:hypothetical protein
MSIHEWLISRRCVRIPRKFLLRLKGVAALSRDYGFEVQTGDSLEASEMFKSHEEVFERHIKSFGKVN